MNSVQVKRVVETVRDFPGLGQKIRQARERTDRSLADLCRECKLSRSYWYQLENEDLRSPATEDVIRRIEAVLNADLGVSFEANTSMPGSYARSTPAMNIEDKDIGVDVQNSDTGNTGNPK